MNPKNLPKIWLDITSSAFWSDKPHGIIRAEQSLSLELEKIYGDQFKRCRWNGREFEASEHQTEKTPRKQQVSQQPQPKLIFPILSKRDALKALAQGALSLTPFLLRPLLSRAMLSLKACIVFVLIEGLWKQGFWRPIRPAKDWAIFNAGDILISVGMNWGHTYYQQFDELRRARSLKIITCCHDITSILYPQYCQRQLNDNFPIYMRKLAAGSDLMLCVSKNTKQDLEDFLKRMGEKLPRTCLIKWGDNVPAKNDETLSTVVAQICQSPFILYVSTIERRKNHDVLYRAYHLLCASGKADFLPKLVFAGRIAWGVDDLITDIELDPLTQGRIILLNRVNDHELHALYQATQFCVFPSLYEGWGLPVGEALAMGKAVIASDRGSLPEVGGETVHYVDAWDTHAWADALYRMSMDENWRAKWQKKVLQNYRPHQWHDTAIAIKNSIDSMQAEMNDA